MTRWTFWTNHGMVFIYKFLHPDSTIREIALSIGLTERAVHTILRALESEGYLMKQRVGRGMVYSMNPDMPLRHPLIQHVQVKEFLAVIAKHERQRRNGRKSGAAIASPSESAA